MEKLPKHTTDEIREILEGCKSGELNHNQQNFHCGTKHCIAGWKEVFDFAKYKKDPAIKIADEGLLRDLGLSEFTSNEEDCGDFYWGYAESAWDITSAEADILFSPSSDFDLQFALLERLESGERVIDKFDFLARVAPHLVGKI
jgi:hypothetical protein